MTVIFTLMGGIVLFLLATLLFIAPNALLVVAGSIALIVFALFMSYMIGQLLEACFKWAKEEYQVYKSRKAYEKRHK